ncbi:hypothetical protein B0H11DRAFT_1914843 [Mycena galericulata]|nr:hypothetical protein B0H11DRAFT_1914843 [Mycena galericulata]
MSAQTLLNSIPWISVRMDTGCGYTRGFVPAGAGGYGYGPRFQTRARPAYPTRVPAGTKFVFVNKNRTAVKLSFEAVDRERERSNFKVIVVAVTWRFSWNLFHEAASLHSLANLKTDCAPK